MDASDLWDVESKLDTIAELLRENNRKLDELNEKISGLKGFMDTDLTEIKDVLDEISANTLG